MDETYTLLAKTRIKVVVPDDHVLANRKKVSIDDLQDETLIILKTGSSTFSSQLANGAAIPLDSDYQISNVQTILTMVRDHIGISMMPDLVIADNRENLRIIDLDPSLEIHIGLMKTLEVENPELVSLFASHAHDWAKNQGLI